MKNINVLIAAAIATVALVCSCSPVRVAYDYRDKDGGRIVLTSDKPLYHDLSMALGAKVMNQKDTIMAILITYDGDSDHGMFDTDDQLLMRLSDQSVIALQNLYHQEFEKETTTSYTTDRVVTDLGWRYTYDPYIGGVFVTPVQLEQFIPRQTRHTTTKSYALYLITKQQLNDIIGKGVIKFRVEMENAELDMPEGGPSCIAALMAEQYACVKERLSHTHVKKAF